jgi:hypothetical protein
VYQGEREHQTLQLAIRHEAIVLGQLVYMILLAGCFLVAPCREDDTVLAIILMLVCIILHILTLL